MKYLDNILMAGLASFYFALIYFNFEELEYSGRLLLYAIGSLLVVAIVIKKEDTV